MESSTLREPTMRRSIFPFPFVPLLFFAVSSAGLLPGHAVAQSPAVPTLQRFILGSDHDHPLFRILLIALLLIVAFLPVFFWFMRRQIKKRTGELLISQERYRHMVQNAGDILYLTDDQGSIHYINPIAEVILGYKAGEMEGRFYWEFIHPDFREAIRAFYLGQREEKTPNTYHEIPLLRKDSQIVWIGQNTQLFEDKGRVIGFQAIARDISVRKRVEQELDVTRKRLTRAEIISRSGNWEFDLKSKRVFASEGARRVYGLPDAEWTIPDVQTIPLPEYRPLLNEALRGLINENRPYKVEFRIRRPDTGETADIRSVAEYDHDREVVFGIIQDITDRKRAEEDLRENRRFLSELIEYSGTLIFVKDGEGRYEMINRKWEEVTGIKRGEVLGRTDEELFPGPIGQQFRRNDVEVMEAGVVQEKEEILDDPKGRRFFISIKFPLRGENGEVRGLCGVTTEITERKRAEEERRSLQERLQRAEKMEALGTLAGGVAHDLNNVLGILIGYSELLLNDIPAESRLRSHVEKIMNGGGRAAAIVQDLLTLARRGVHSESVVNLNAVIEEFRKMPEFENLHFSHPRVLIRADLAPDLLNIKGSPFHLYKTLMNLLTNAAEAMPRGGTVTVTTGNRNLDRPVQGYDDVREGDFAVLSVSDTGEGITSADMKHIFEPFYTKKVMGRSGTGLGLAVVWGTVKDHHGYIDVQSEPGKGTTFTLYIPVTRESPAAAETAIPLSEYIGRDESILVVDDIREQRELAASMLGRLNYKVETAVSGEEAVEVLKGHPVDLVVLDMIMEPGMDGLDTYRKILEIRPGQKAIIVSGFSETDRVLEAQALGAGDYIRKPYIQEKLGLAVRKELDRK
jgi:two-component system cell cycle sensor histidine kinase/response regulator CckA